MNTIDPSKVKAGDMVRVRFIETGEEFTTKAYRPESITKPGPWVFLLGWPLNKGTGGHGLAVKYFEILDHQPAHQPEWKPGTTGTATVRGVEGVRVIRASTQHGAWFSANCTDGFYLHPESMVTAFVPDDAEALRRQIEADSDVNYLLREENAHYKAEVDRLRDALDAAQERARIANRDARDEHAEVERLRARHSASEAEVVELARRLQDAEASRDALRGAIALYEQGGAAPKVTREQAAEVLWLNERQRPWANANREDRAVLLSAADAVIARMGGAE